MSKDKFKKQAARAQQNALLLASVLITPQLTAAGYITDTHARDSAIVKAAEESELFASMHGKGADIALIGASAIREYENQTGELPSQELLASAATQLQSLYAGVEGEVGEGDHLLASLNSDAMSSTKGIDVITNTAAIILPTLLANPLNDAINYLPAPRKGETEIFNVERVAGSTFAGLKKNDIINSMTSERYTQTRQRFVTPNQPDGTRTTFPYNSENHGMELKTPFVKGVVRVYVDRKLVATDFNKDSKIFGTVNLNDSDVAVTGSIDYTNGTADITFGTAPANGVEVAIGFDVDIESDPSLIPKIDHKMESFKVYPSQRVIAADASIMAMFSASTEHGISLRSLNLASMRNILADEKARNQLADIYWATTEATTFDADVTGANDWRVEYEKLRAKLESMSSMISDKTEEGGMVGMYCGRDWATLCKSLPSSMFEFAPNYQQKNVIHYVGRLFGRYKIYEVPQVGLMPADEFIGYGKSNNIGRCGYLTGDVVAPTLYSHEVNRELNKGDTIWAYGYDEIHPRDGADFFIKCKLTNYTMAG